jgi:hypothetical protein
MHELPDKYLLGGGWRSTQEPPLGDIADDRLHVLSMEVLHTGSGMHLHKILDVRDEVVEVCWLVSQRIVHEDGAVLEVHYTCIPVCAVEITRKHNSLDVRVEQKHMIDEHCAPPHPAACQCLVASNRCTVPKAPDAETPSRLDRAVRKYSERKSTPLPRYCVPCLPNTQWHAAAVCASTASMHWPSIHSPGRRLSISLHPIWHPWM